MLTRSELTDAQAEDLLEKIQSDVFAGINCGWRGEVFGYVWRLWIGPIVFVVTSLIVSLGNSLGMAAEGSGSLQFNQCLGKTVEFKLEREARFKTKMLCNHYMELHVWIILKCKAEREDLIMLDCLSIFTWNVRRSKIWSTKPSSYTKIITIKKIQDYY